MIEHGCRLGGEVSGHIVFSKYASSGDGILTALKIMEVMLASKKKLSALTSGMTLYPQALANVKVNDKTLVMEDEEILTAISNISNKLEGTGRILVRESGTEPLIRVMVEAENEDICKHYVDEIVQLIKDKGYAV